MIILVPLEILVGVVVQ